MRRSSRGLDVFVPGGNERVSPFGVAKRPKTAFPVFNGLPRSVNLGVRMIRSDRLPIAAALVAAFSLSAFDACATPPAVTNCNDSGTGSLRASVTGAASGSVINLSSLQCSPITLTSGAIVVAQDDLLIYGPGRDKLTIQGEQATGSGAVFDHFGGGLLELDHMTIATGSVYSNDANK